MTAETFMVSALRASALRALNYTPGVDRLRNARAPLRVRRLGDLVERIGGSFGSVFTRVDCDDALGVPLYSQVDTFAAVPEGRTIRRDAMPRPDDQAVKRWQVLIAAAGQMAEGNLFGRSIVADARLVGGYCGPDTLALTFAHPGSEDNLWTAAFLNTRLGLRAIRACAYGTSIPRLRPDLVAEIPVPQAAEDIRTRVAALVRRAVEMRETYLRELRAARAIVETLPEMEEASRLCDERRARAVMWHGPLSTLMGWTYASHGGALAFLRQRWRKSVGDALPDDGAFYGLLRQRTPCDPGRGVPLISQRDAHAIRQLPVWIARPGVPHNALFSPPHSIVMAGRGTLGEGEVFARPAYVTPGLSRFALTQDLLRLVPKRGGEAGLLFAYLSTLVGRRLLRACAVGTKIMQLRLDLLRALPFPELPDMLASKLEQHHAHSVAAYDAAADAETEAIRIIEEEVLPAWLD